MEANIKFGEAGGPYQTIVTKEVKKTDKVFKPSRNTRKIPSEYMVKYKNRWRRVYCCIIGNSGVCYVVIDGENVFVDLYNGNKAL